MYAVCTFFVLRAVTIVHKAFAHALARLRVYCFVPNTYVDFDQKLNVQKLNNSGIRARNMPIGPAQVKPRSLWSPPP